MPKGLTTQERLAARKAKLDAQRKAILDAQRQVDSQQRELDRKVRTALRYAAGKLVEQYFPLDDLATLEAVLKRASEEAMVQEWEAADEEVNTPLAAKGLMP
jgi:molecular chaperone GrpE (heat shock protein)